MYTTNKDIKELTNDIEAIMKRIAAVETKNLTNSEYLSALVRLELLCSKKLQANLGDE